MDKESVSLLPMLIGLAGGLALFLHGMTMMSTAMRAMAGSRLKSIMAKLAGNRLSALLTGVVITTVVQSSSVTSVIAIGFVSAGILSLGQALAVIMGAAVGSTVTAQIIAFDVSNLAFLLAAIGFALSMWKSRRILSLMGTVILGLGVLFIGLSMMSAFMSPLRTYQPFLDLMASMSNPLVGILIGAAFTAVVQSSSATLGVIIALASQGLIPLHAGIALVFGANIGTTITGIFATIGQPRTALHAAAGLLGFKLLLVAIWLPLMGLLERITRAISPSAGGMALAEQLAYEVPRQVANVHMIVNVTTVLVLLPFTEVFARLIVRILGEGKASSTQADHPSPDLNPVLLEMPPLALDAARREVVHLGDHVEKLLDAAATAIERGGNDGLESLRQAERLIDSRHAEICRFLERVVETDRSPETTRIAIDLIEAADYLEAIGDLVEREILPLHVRHAERGEATSSGKLQDLYQSVRDEFERALQAVANNDQTLARAIIDAKAEMRALERSAIDISIDENPDGALRLTRTSARDRELIESIRRGYSLIRRFVRAGTGLQRESGISGPGNHSMRTGGTDSPGELRGRTG